MLRFRIARFVCVLAASLAPTSAELFAQSNDLGEMIRIPAGTFVMGSSDGPDDERPQHRVEVAEYFIDRTKVTNAQFALFLNAIGPEGPKGERYFDSDDSDARVHRRNGNWVGGCRV